MRVKFNKNKRFCTKFGFKMNNIIYAVFLASLMEKPLYGYLLVEKLEEFGIKSNFVPYGSAYRILRDMEFSGLVSSEWQTEGTGPAKRVYKITDKGIEFLRDWLVDAKKNLETLEKILKKVGGILNEQDK